ncbi:MAG TPA: hypothetical protein VFC63_28910 [Blastocatellia bacterium]|nr:hypothetical protein [Blastocatellia bacterium]
MESRRVVIVLLRENDSPLPFKPQEYELYPFEVVGLPFESVCDFIKEKGASAILIDVPEEAADIAIKLCQQIKAEPQLEAFPLIALLRLPTRAIVTAVIEAGVDDAVLLPITEEAIKERLERLGMGFSETETATPHYAAPPS